MIKIYHNSNFLKDAFNQIVTGELKHVANVYTDDLNEAFYLTNHINCDWTFNKEVEIVCERPLRSSSPGDVFEKNGEKYLIDYIGFIKID